MNQSDSRRAFLAAGIGAAAWALEPASAETQNLVSLTLKKASELSRSKGVSSVELTEAFLKRIDKYNPLVNAFISVNSESALAIAQAMDVARTVARGLTCFVSSWIIRLKAEARLVNFYASCVRTKPLAACLG